MENDFCNIFPGLGLLDSLESETVQILRTYHIEDIEIVFINM